MRRLIASFIRSYTECREGSPTWCFRFLPSLQLKMCSFGCGRVGGPGSPCFLMFKTPKNLPLIPNVPPYFVVL